MSTAALDGSADRPAGITDRAEPHRPHVRQHWSYLLAFGFGVAVSMWGLGFLARMPPVWVPSWLLLLLLLVCQVAGGYAAGRGTGLGLRAGLGVGAVSSIINLLVLGSLFGGEDPNALAPHASVWIPATILAGVALSGIGAALGRNRTAPIPWSSAARNSSAEARHGSAESRHSSAESRHGSAESRHGSAEARHSSATSALDRDPPDAGAPQAGPLVGDKPAVVSLRPPYWTGKFAQVAALATFFLLLVGGMVTSKEAGLAVVDWPNSFGYNMFLFPLSKMTGGVYFEHSHRLFGALVGLATLVLAVHLQFVEPRRWVRGLALLALVLVITQGILGGLRVTGHFTTSTDPSVTAPNLTLAMIHGVLGQIFFATLVGLAAFTSPSWQLLPAAIPRRDASRDHRWTLVTVLLLVPQLVLGALYRHMEGGLHLHLTLAVLVVGAAHVAAIRGFALHKETPLYARLGKTLLWLVSLQILLGLGALIAVSLARNAPEPPTYEVVVATAHQATGALLLAVSTLMLVWSRRLFRAA